MTVPNLITTVRIILAPVFIIYLINRDLELALMVFVIAGISDGVDGLVARFFNQKSRLGTFLDPLADKILLVSAFIALAVVDLLPSWVTVTVISRDILILLGIMVLFLYRIEINIKPSLLSKLTTCLQIITVIGALSREILPFPKKMYFYLFSATAFITITSGLHYMHFWFKLMGESGTDGKEGKKPTEE
jgi:cardiolipin synthase